MAHQRNVKVRRAYEEPAASDGRRVLVQKEISASDVQCYELDVTTGGLKDLTIRPEGGTAACEIAGYMPGERAVLLLSDFKDGMQRLYVKELKSGAVREPIPALGRFELDGAGPNDTREYLLAVTNQDGYGVLSVYTLPDFQPVPLPTMDQGVVSPASFRGSTLVWSLSNARTAGVAFATTFARAGKGGVTQTTRQLTWTNEQGIDQESFPLPELVRGRPVVAHNNLHGDVVNMGAIYTDRDVVIDGDLITARTGGHCHMFARAIIDRLAAQDETADAASPRQEAATVA